MRTAKKLRSRKGTTLVELLAAVAVLILFSLMITTGLNLALHSYHAMISESESQLLLSTAVDAVTDELRYARDVETEADGTLKQYKSETFGYYCTLAVNGDGQLEVQEAGTPQPLLATGSYGRNGIYRVDLPGGIRYDAGSGTFQFELAVSENGVEKAKTSMQVRCLNGQEAP